jgi:hypothetical protein
MSGVKQKRGRPWTIKGLLDILRPHRTVSGLARKIERRLTETHNEKEFAEALLTLAWPAGPYSNLVWTMGNERQRLLQLAFAVVGSVLLRGQQPFLDKLIPPKNPDPLKSLCEVCVVVSPPLAANAKAVTGAGFDPDDFERGVRAWVDEIGEPSWKIVQAYLGIRPKSHISKIFFKPPSEKEQQDVFEKVVRSREHWDSDEGFKERYESLRRKLRNETDMLSPGRKGILARPQFHARLTAKEEVQWLKDEVEGPPRNLNVIAEWAGMNYHELKHHQKHNPRLKLYIAEWRRGNRDVGSGPLRDFEIAREQANECRNAPLPSPGKPRSLVRNLVEYKRFKGTFSWLDRRNYQFRSGRSNSPRRRV